MATVTVDRSALPPVVRLANDIAAQFVHHPVDEAGTLVAQHMRQFWDPRMRAELLALPPEDRDLLDDRARAAADVLASA